jgi:hypothetical protein
MIGGRWGYSRSSQSVIATLQFCQLFLYAVTLKIPYNSSSLSRSPFIRLNVTVRLFEGGPPSSSLWRQSFRSFGYVRNLSNTTEQNTDPEFQSLIAIPICISYY